MVRMNTLADALKCINNAEKKSKRQVLIRPSSKTITKFLSVMMKHGYIGEYEIIDGLGAWSDQNLSFRFLLSIIDAFKGISQSVHALHDGFCCLQLSLKGRQKGK